MREGSSLSWKRNRISCHAKMAYSGIYPERKRIFLSIFRNIRPKQQKNEKMYEAYRYQWDILPLKLVNIRKKYETVSEVEMKIRPK